MAAALGARFPRWRSIEEEIAQLYDLDLRGLRLRWQNMLAKSPPEHVTRYLLFRVLAYRLQADRHLSWWLPLPIRPSSQLRKRGCSTSYANRSSSRPPPPTGHQPLNVRSSDRSQCLGAICDQALRSGYGGYP
jgi:hypothetical protein